MNSATVPVTAMTTQTNNTNARTAVHNRMLRYIVEDADKYKNAESAAKMDILSNWSDHIVSHLRIENNAIANPVVESSYPPDETVGRAIIEFFEATTDILMAATSLLVQPRDLKVTALLGIVPVINVLASPLDNALRTMSYLLNDLNWNPDRLWSALAFTQDFAKSQLALKDKSWQVQPFWLWTKQLGVQACLTNWKPNNNTLSDKMWYVTPFRHLPNPDATVAAMATKVPWSFGAALEFYQDEPEEDVSADMAKTIFQMDYAQANATLSTQLLLSLMFNYSRYQSYSEGMQIFQNKHPDLFAAFELQVSLYDSQKDADHYASECETAWMHSIQEHPIDCMALPDLGLECP